MLLSIYSPRAAQLLAPINTRCRLFSTVMGDVDSDVTTLRNAFVAADMPILAPSALSEIAKLSTSLALDFVMHIIKHMLALDLVRGCDIWSL